jgi:hypothetical protein
VPKDEASTSRLGGSQDQTWPRSEASNNNDEAKPDAEKGLGEVAVEQSRVPEEKAETKTEARTSSQWLPK